MSVIGSNILAGASGQGGDYTIARSLRFRSSASAYLSRTPATTTNRKTWTWSAWVKRGDLSRRQWLFQQSDTAGDRQIQLEINAGNAIRFGWYDVGVGTGFIITNALYRDPSAWYHIMYSVDTTQATDTNRVKIYVNGVQVTSLDGGSTYPPQNFDTSVNTTNPMRLGSSITPSLFFDGYLTEVNFIDGQALTPSDFGANNASTGVWQPKKYAGTYGTNGFYLPFSNNASTSTLGNDFSGNGNNWTTNNISLTAGSTYDSMTDVPTLTSATAANFAVMNPLDQAGGLVFSEANLRVTAATGWDGARATFSLPSTGKYYWETTCISRSSGASVGLLSTSAVITGDLGAAATGYVYNSGDGNRYNNGSASSYGATWGTNDIIGISWDADAGTLVFYKNGTSQGTAWTGLSGTFSPAIGVNGSDSMNANFGQRPFAYTPPTGFVALNTFNLPTPTIGATASTQANKYFDIATYNNATVVSGLGFAPDFVWHKSRNQAYSHYLYDKIRGTGAKGLNSNTTSVEGANDALGIVSFDSSGVTYSSDAGLSQTNAVGWFWKAGGTGVSNTAGSITSTVSANTSAGFSVVTYTLNNSTFTVGHGLGVAPKMIMVKNRDAGNNWDVYHASLGAGVRLKLNSTDGQNSSTQVWNNTAPTSTVFSGDSAWWTNPSSARLVAYCFADVQGYQKIGSYTGNGSTDGPFIFTGFRPKFVLIKSASGDNWTIVDTSRNTYNVADARLFPSSSSAEATGTANCDILSNGFKVRIGSTDTGANGNGTTYIYLAIAETPTKYSLAR